MQPLAVQIFRKRRVKLAFVVKNMVIRGVVEAFYNGVIDAARHIRRTLLVTQVIKRA